MPPAATGGSWRKTVLYKFGGSDGLFPQSGLVFGLDGDLYSFQGEADGEYPSAIAVGNEGSLFGTAVSGGTASASCDGGTYGTVFKLAPPVDPGGAWIETTQYSFSGSDGSHPFSLIVGTNAILYGTTLYGGVSNTGTVFELKP
jgi:hypothetical protein